MIVILDTENAKVTALDVSPDLMTYLAQFQPPGAVFLAPGSDGAIHVEMKPVQERHLRSVEDDEATEAAILKSIDATDALVMRLANALDEVHADHVDGFPDCEACAAIAAAREWAR